MGLIVPAVMPLPGSLLRSRGSVANLLPTLTVNSIGVTPKYRHIAPDASATDWAADGYGSTLAVGGTDAFTLNAGSPFYGPDDDGVLYAGTGYSGDTIKHHRLADGTAYSLTEFDCCFEMFFTTPGSAPTAGSWIVMQGAYGSDGYSVVLQPDMELRFNIYNGLCTCDSAALATSTAYHAMWFCNRDENSTDSARWYVEGAVSGEEANMWVGNTDNTNSDSFEVAAYTTTGDYGFGGKLHYFAMYQHTTTWFQAGSSGPAEWATIAAARRAALYG